MPCIPLCVALPGPLECIEGGTRWLKRDDLSRVATSAQLATELANVCSCIDDDVDVQIAQQSRERVVTADIDAEPMQKLLKMLSQCGHKAIANAQLRIAHDAIKLGSEADLAESRRRMNAKRQGRLRQAMRAVLLGFARKFGAVVKDESGRVLGRALMIPFRGRIHVIGLETPVRLVWVPQSRITYWKQEICFAQHSRPDFPHVRTERASSTHAEASRHTENDVSTPPLKQSTVEGEDAAVP